MVKEVHREFERVGEAYERLLEVWGELDPKGIDIVMPEDIAETLVGLGVAVEMRAARQIMKRTLGEQVTIQRKEFLSLFLRGLLHLHLKALQEVIGSDSSSRFLECTRYIIMAGLGLEEYAEGQAIVHRLEEVSRQQGQWECTAEEYYQAMAELLLPPGYVRTPTPQPPPHPTVSPAVLSVSEAVPILVFTPFVSDYKPVAAPAVIPVTIINDMSLLCREDAEELQRSDPLALEGKIVFSEVRPVSEKASMRSTVTDLIAHGREKRYSLQERLVTEAASVSEEGKAEIEVKQVEPVAVKPSQPSRTSTRARRRKGHSRATTAPSLSPGQKGPTYGSLSSTAASLPYPPGSALHQEFERLVEFVPHVEMGLFLRK